MADLPASSSIVKSNFEDTFVILAREIAIDHYPLETILERNRITTERWLEIQSNPHFQQILIAEVQAWNSALNTEQRTKLKAAAIVEEFLPEAHGRLHDATQLLSSKTELAKLIARIAGIGLTGAGVEGAVDRFSVTINLGAANSVKIEGKSPAKTIDAVAIPVE